MKVNFTFSFNGKAFLFLFLLFNFLNFNVNATIDVANNKTNINGATCTEPTLAVGGIICNDDFCGGNYSIEYVTDPNAIITVLDETLTHPVGLVGNTSITNIPLGTNIVIISSFPDCTEENRLSITGPVNCISCDFIPDLAVGQPQCNNSENTYTFNYTENSGASIIIVGGEDIGNQTVKGILGTDITITAYQCEETQATIEVISPNCPINCDFDLIFLEDVNCDADGDTTYNIPYKAIENTIVVAYETGTMIEVGTVTDTKINGINLGTNVDIVATNTLCTNTTQITVNSPNGPCQECIMPDISVNNVGASNPGANNYIVNYQENTNAVITISGGTETSPGVITSNAIDTVVTITATNGNCISSITVNPPLCGLVSQCRTLPNINIEDYFCNSTSYAFTYNKSALATIFVYEAGTTNEIGTIEDSIVSNIPLNTDIDVLVSFTDCDSSLTYSIINPNSCDCLEPNLLLGQIICNGTSDTSVLNFTETTGAIITVTGGDIIGDGQIEVPDSSDGVTVTATNGECQVSIYEFNSNFNNISGCNENALSANDAHLSNFKISPNPASSYITIDLPERIIINQVFIYSISGKEVFTATEKNINTLTLQSGFYILKIITDKGSASKKLIIK